MATIWEGPNTSVSQLASKWAKMKCRQSTGRREVNFAPTQPACWCHLHMHKRTHKNSAAICQGYCGLSKPATHCASQHKIIPIWARGKLIFCCIRQSVDWIKQLWTDRRIFVLKTHVEKALKGKVKNCWLSHRLSRNWQGTSFCFSPCLFKGLACA